MNADRLLALYEKVAEAPDAVPRLYRFVLDLAVRGKLEPQDAGDEPASDLLQRIAAEKARLVKAGEIRKPRDLANGDELVPPFDIPATWRWCRLDTVGAIIGGGTPSAGDPDNFAEPGEGIPWLTPADLGGYRELSIERGARDLTEKGLASSSATMMPAETVLFTSRAPIGYVAIAANPISTNQGFKSIVPYVADCSRFIALAMQTFAPEIDAKAPGTTFKEVSGKIVAGVPFPLPPLAEQRRIVGKVEELMALLDRLEAARTARESTRDRLTAASLARLTAPDTDPTEFPVNARFALATLPALTTRPDQIKPLRQTILNLAVRGELVEQDPTDEPADVTLASISRNKETLIKAKKLKKSKAISNPISLREEVELPAGWAWASCDEIFFITKLAGFEYTKYFDLKDQGEVPVIRAQNVRPWLVEARNLKFIPEKVSSELERSAITKPSLLVTFIGAGIGDVALFEPDRRWHLAPNVAKAELFEGCENKLSMRYLVLFFNSPFGRAEVFKHVKVAAQPSLSMGTIRDIDVIIPPLAEQHRIVAKVDALMALCDRLEAALTTSDTTRARLLEALLHEALEPGAGDREAA
ncbi:MAG: restriction endonuclease subunit S [Oceanibaculum nanhaiense]|uniref:restriction endonuclease subunit S n=1 Tax=Oceanibaculum nanhaiense TaxID=1909734 RepID=UPI0025A3BC99|nr:restriction endonuclease subunit S [Oceanibaculum nanhaiense]MDM7945249.1 restriction endonuclease subunit S [Oceanibaculum nanhaiense]